VVDLAEALGTRTLLESYDQGWLDWATMSTPRGPIVGGLFSFCYLPSVVWYPKAAFEKAGYEVPTTWTDLLTLSDRIVEAGGTPWGFGNATWFGGSSQTWATDILLRTTSLTDYDRLWRGGLKFNSPQVRQALRMMFELWLKPEYAFGGRETINQTEMWDLPKPMLEELPKLWMTDTPSYFPVYDGRSTDTAFAGKEFGKDFDFFLLPPIDPAYGAPVLMEGHLVSMLRDTSESRALMEYVASGTQGEVWARQVGLGATPRKGARLEWYPDALSRKVAEVMATAPRMRYAAYSLMPYAANLEMGFSLVEYIDGNADLDTALDQIDRSWPGAV
jgi:alpha-glucoside transport system substrate-binding protein